MYHANCKHCGKNVWLARPWDEAICAPCEKNGGKRCEHCGSTSCQGSCPGKAAFVERQRVVVYLRQQKHPMAEKWAKEIEAGAHIETPW